MQQLLLDTLTNLMHPGLLSTSVALKAAQDSMAIPTSRVLGTLLIPLQSMDSFGYRRDG